MFSRRPGPRFNRGRIATAAGVSGPPPEPTGTLQAASEPAAASFAGTVVASGADILDLLTTFPSRTVQYLYVGDYGYTSAAGTTTWADQSAQARNLTIADATAPVSTAYPAINGKLALLGNGTDQYIQSTAFNRGANWWYLFVFMPVSWTAGDHLMGSTATASRQAIVQNPTSSPNMRMQGTANGATNAGATVGNWHRMRAQFSGGTAAFLRIGSTNATGVDPGTAASSGIRFLAGGTGTPAGYANMALALALALDDAPTGPEQSAADSLITAYYGASVAVG